MSATERNKIFAAVLITALAVRGIDLAVETIFDKEVPTSSAWIDPNASVGVAQVSAAPSEPSIDVLLLSANAEAGANVFRRCKACHTNSPNGAKKSGPALWQVFGRNLASVDGYRYSAALTKAAQDGEVWDAETLNRFLINPKKSFKGTKMTFAGLKKGTDRANIIAWLKSQSEQ